MTTVYFIKETPDAILPTRAHPTDAGMDLYSAEDVVLEPNGGRAIVSTGLKIGISPDMPFQREQRLTTELRNSNIYLDIFVWQAEVRPRSGLAAKKGVTVLNTPGTIDNGYRNTLKVIMVNHELEHFEIKKGDKIAQLIFTKSYILPIEEVSEFPDGTKRGKGGFGSTGTK